MKEEDKRKSNILDILVLLANTPLTERERDVILKEVYKATIVKVTVS